MYACLRKLHSCLPGSWNHSLIDWKSRVEFLSTYSTIKLLTPCLAYPAFLLFWLLRSPPSTKAQKDKDFSLNLKSPTMGLKELRKSSLDWSQAKKTFKLAFASWLFFAKHRGGMNTLLSHSNSPTVCCVCFQAIRLLAKRTTADEVPHTCTST